MKYESDNIRLDLIKNSLGKPWDDNIPSEYELWNSDYITEIYSRGNGVYDYYELWTSDCWKGAYTKQEEYKGKTKEEVLKLFVEQRFSKILELVNCRIIKWDFDSYEKILNIQYMEEQDLKKESKIKKGGIGIGRGDGVPSQYELWSEDNNAKLYYRGNNVYDYYILWTSEKGDIESFLNNFKETLNSGKYGHGEIEKWNFNEDEEILHIRVKGTLFKQGKLRKVAEDIAPANVLEDAGVVDEAPPDDIGDLGFGGDGGDMGGGIGGMDDMGEPGMGGGQKPSPNDDIDWDKFFIERTPDLDNYLEDYYDGLTGVNFSRLT